MATAEAAESAFQVAAQAVVEAVAQAMVAAAVAGGGAAEAEAEAVAAAVATAAAPAAVAAVAAGWNQWREGGRVGRSRRRRLAAGSRPARPRTWQDLMPAGAEVTAHNLNRSER